MTLDQRRVPEDVMAELVAHVEQFVDLGEIPLAQFDVKGTTLIQHGDIAFKLPYDTDHYLGGEATVIGKASGLALAPYMGYVDGTFYQTETYCWNVDVDVEVSNTDRLSPGGVARVAIADVYDAAPLEIVRE